MSDNPGLIEALAPVATVLQTMEVRFFIGGSVASSFHGASRSPGMRMARWALAKQYGKNIAYTGPIYSGYEVKGNQVIVSFEKESLFGGLMVGSKGMARDYQEPDKYVEPAKPTPNERLNHFRLCGRDKMWHVAEAVIAGDTVVVTAKNVPEPVGVQCAYNAVPDRSVQTPANN